MGPFTHTLRQGHPKDDCDERAWNWGAGTTPHEAFQEVFLEEVTDCPET